MTKTDNNGKEMMIRAVDCALKLGAIVPASGQALVTSVQTILADINESSGKQNEGSKQASSGSRLRREAAKELRTLLAEMALTARRLDPTHPGLVQLMRLGKGVQSYQALQDTGKAFIAAVTPAPIKTAFTARGYAATFAEDLATQIAKLDASASTKYGGLNQQVNSTRKVSELVKKGVSLVRDLDDLVSRPLRKTDPAAYQEWKQAIHIRSRKQKASDTPAAPGTPAAPASPTPASTPTPAPANG